jgi:hypothetical protein
MFVGWAFYIYASLSMNGIALYGGDSREFFAIMLIGFLIFFISLFVGPILLALGAIPLPVAAANMASEGKLAAAFRIRQWWPALWHNKLGYFIAFAVFLGLAAMMYFATTLIYVTMICCWLIPFLSVPAGFYLALVYAALFGVTFRQSIEPEPATSPAEGEAAPAVKTPAPAVEETPASQPAGAAETPAEAAPAAEGQDKPKPAPSIRRKKIPPAPETPA